MSANATLTVSSEMSAAEPRILVVDDEPALIELMDEIVSRHIRCRIVSADSIGAARRAMAKEDFSLLLADVNLPDGNGTALVPELRRLNASAEAIVITGAPTVDGAVDAMRQGAVDFIAKPFSAEQIVDRVEKALARQAAGVRAGRRARRLRDTVRRLNEARRTVAKQVDLLCNDLIGAYGDLARQVNDMRAQEGFRGYISQTRDLEQMLCHTMDWLLRQLGYSNVAIWLACDDQEFQLGAYMKHTLAGEEAMTDAMKNGLVPQTVRAGHLLLNGEDVESALTVPELDYLADQSIMAVNCTYLGESLAVVTLFRDGRDPFTEEHAGLLKQISPVFACALAEVVKTEQAADLDGYSQDDGFPTPGHESADAADWWKRGEAPPF
jgi:FixJ family two-component response regulator